MRGVVRVVDADVGVARGGEFPDESPEQAFVGVVADRPAAGPGFGVEEVDAAPQGGRVAADRLADLVHLRRAGRELRELGVEVGVEAHRVPDVGVAGGVRHHPGRERGHHDRNAGRLHRRGVHHRTVDRVEAALVARDLLAEQPRDDLEVLAETIHPLARRPVGHPEHLHRRVHQHAGAEPELQPPSGDVIDGDRLVGQHARAAQRDLGHARGQSDRRGVGGHRGQRGPGLEPGCGRVGPVDEVVPQLDDVEPGVLHPPDPVPVLGPRHVGQRQDVEPQVRHLSPPTRWGRRPTGGRAGCGRSRTAAGPPAPRRRPRTAA